MAPPVQKKLAMHGAVGAVSPVVLQYEPGVHEVAFCARALVTNVPRSAGTPYALAPSMIKHEPVAPVATQLSVVW